MEAARKEVDQVNKDLRAARAEVVKSQKNVTETLRKIEAEVDKKDDVAVATAAVGSAKKAYDEASAPVLAALEGRADYMEAVRAASSAQSHVEAVNANEAVSNADRMTAVREAADAREAVAKIRSAALDGTPGVAGARAVFVSAGKELARLRATYLNVKDNEEYRSAKAAVEDARTKVSQLEEDLREAQKKLAEAKAQAAAESQKNRGNGNGVGRGPGGR